MANMNFGVNILPKANNTYTLGNSDYKWNIFANTLNGITLTNIITDIQIDGTSIVNNNIATIPLATSSSFGVIKLGYGLLFDSNQKVAISAASSGKIKAGADYNFPIVPVRQHESVFYGLAKAAGDSTQSASENAIGVYTDGAKAAISTMLGVPQVDDLYVYAPKASYATPEGWRLNESDGLCSSNSSYKLIKYEVKAGQRIKVISDDRFQFQSQVSVPSTGTSNRVSGTSTYGIGTFILTVPQSATYLIVSTPMINSTAEVRDVYMWGMDTSDNLRVIGDVYINCNADSTGGTKVATISQLPSIMTGATSSVAGTSGLVPAPATTDIDKFLAGDGTYKSGGLPMVILSYGNSTWAEFENAYNNNVIVYCRASSGSNPASGSQTRMAFMAYVNNATTPTEVEFQYYRSMSSHSATAMGDQVFVYKLTKTSGWSVTTRDASIKQIKAGASGNLSVSWNSNVVTIDGGLPAVTSTDNGKILSVVNGSWSAVTMQQWQGGSY